VLSGGNVEPALEERLRSEIASLTR
jgi:hypothetical protein